MLSIPQDPPPDTGAADQRQALIVPLEHARIGVEAFAAAITVRRKERCRTAVALVVAVGLHGSVALLDAIRPPEPFGAGGTSLDAISIEVALVPATALESRPAASVPAAGAPASLDMDDGTPAPQPATPAAAPPQPKVAAAPDVPLIVAKPDPTPPDPEALVLPVAETKPPPTPDPVQSEPKPDVVKAPETPQPPAIKATAALPAPAAPRGGAAAQTVITPVPPRPGAAAASAGAAQAYARRVAEVLSRNRPSATSGNGSGTVRLSFAISEDGGIDDLQVRQSSGQPRIDSLAVAAVRRAKFPAPPPGMSRTERTYEIPYHFR